MHFPRKEGIIGYAKKQITKGFLQVMRQEFLVGGVEKVKLLLFTTHWISSDMAMRINRLGLFVDRPSSEHYYDIVGNSYEKLLKTVLCVFITAIVES